VITDVAGIAVGHWTDQGAKTGCSVVLLPEATAASAEVRGGAPASRELALLEPQGIVQHVDAVVLSGGSAFGLAAGDGVARWLESRGRGFPTLGGPVPIVVGLSLYDLTVGDGSVRPGPDEGVAACEAAEEGPIPVGPVGAGTGATFDKWRLGRAGARAGGLVTATERHGDVVVSALLAVNAVGGVDDGTGPIPGHEVFAGTNTTIGLVATNATFDKQHCHLLAQGGHDGLARALTPSHTRSDGDVLVGVATGQVEGQIDHVRWMAMAAVERAVRGLAADALS